MNPQYFLLGFYLVFIAVMIGVWNIRKIERAFHLTSTQQIMGEESWNKLNRLWQVGEADLSTYSSAFGGGKEYTVRVSYKEANDARVSNSFSDTNVNKAIDKAYAWSIERGYIKE